MLNTRPELRPLVFAIGNPFRGDDALGPTLAAHLIAEGLAEDGDALSAPVTVGAPAPPPRRAAGAVRRAPVELVQDYQLQPEHIELLRDRPGVLFVDAALPLSLAAPIGAMLSPLQPAAALPPFTHAMTPPALLHLARRMDGQAPPAWLLAVEGEAFGLGDTLSPQAWRHLHAALALARAWCRARG